MVVTYIVSATLFEADGTTAIQSLAAANGMQWLDELADPGSFSFTIPVEYAPTIAVGQIVKFALGPASDDYVWAGVVETIRTNLVGSGNDGINRVYEVGGRGVRALLEDAIVYNDGAESTRPFTNVNAGEIMKTLIDEAQTRGALDALTYDFDDTDDSNGDPFTETISIDESVGADLLGVAARHQELAVDVWVDSDLVLHYVNERGIDRSNGGYIYGGDGVVFRVGYNVGELTQETAGPVRNTVLVASGTAGSTFTEEENVDSQTTYGRKEIYLPITNTDDENVIDLATVNLLNSTAAPTDGVTIQVFDNGPIPYLDFEVGDTVGLVRLNGERNSYKVRSISVSMDEAGIVSFVPELGSARPDLTKRLNAALTRIEKANAGGNSTVGGSGGATGLGGGGGDLDIGGGTPLIEFGTVLSYNSNTGTGTVEIDGEEYDFYNGMFADLGVDDVVMTMTSSTISDYSPEIGDIDKIVTSIIETNTGAGGGYPGGTGTQSFVPVSAVPGLPYQPNVGINVFGAADGAVWGNTGTVVSYADATNYTITRPSTSWDNMWGLSDNPNGVWVFVNRSATSNGLHVIYNGSGTTHNYGTCQMLGEHGGKIWVWAGYKAGSVDRRLVSITSTGTVADITSTSLNLLSTSANTTYGVAGGWGIVLWDGTDVVTVATPGGTPAYTQYTSTNFPSLPTGATAYRERACMSDTYFFWLTTTTADRDYRRWHFSSATRTDFIDVLPSGFNHDSIATFDGTDIAIAGDDGTNQQYQITGGLGVTTVTFTDTAHTESFVITNNPAYEVVGRVQSDTSVSQIVGIEA